MEIVHPDDFLLELWEREPRLLVRVIGEQSADTGRHGPRLSSADILDYLASAGAPEFVELVRPHVLKVE